MEVPLEQSRCRQPALVVSDQGMEPQRLRVVRGGELSCGHSSVVLPVPIENHRSDIYVLVEGYVL